MKPALRAVVLFLFVIPALLSAAGAAKDTEEARNLQKLQGVWKLVARERDGLPLELDRKSRLWHIKGDKLQYEGREVGALAVQSGSAFLSIDLTLKEPKQVYEAIGEIKDGKWKICINRMTEGVKDRPVEFSTRGNANYQILVFEQLGPKAGEEALAGQQRRGYVGIQIGLRDNQVVILDAFQDSPAAKAGLKKGDRIVQVGAVPAANLVGVIEAIQATKPGLDLNVKIQRDGQEKDVTVKVGELPLRFLDPLG